MTKRTVEAAPAFYARIGGALYLALIVFGGFAEAVRDRITSGDAATTAVRLASQAPLWRLGVTAEFLAVICAIALAMIYFVLLKPVSRELNLLATFLRLVAITVQAVALVNLLAALFPLGDAAYLRAFTPGQLQAMVRLAIRAHGQGYALGLLLFGVCFLFHGALIFRSTFLPRLIGVLIQIAGVCYFTNSAVLFLAPSLADKIFPAILVPSFIGELSLCLWLLVKGVNVERWKEVNARAATGAAAL